MAALFVFGLIADDFLQLSDYIHIPVNGVVRVAVGFAVEAVVPTYLPNRIINSGLQYSSMNNAICFNSRRLLSESLFCNLSLIPGV